MAAGQLGGDAVDRAGERGGAMDGESLSPERVLEISKWPTRT